MFLQLLQHLDRLNDMDHSMMVHLFRCVEEIVNLDQMHLRHLQGVEKMDVLQIRDEQNLDVVPTFQDVLHHFLADEQVDVEPRHLLKMDYYQDVVLALVLLLQAHSHLNSVVLEHVASVLPLPLLLLHVQP